LEAIAVWKLTIDSSKVSTSCASSSGPVTRSTGSWAKKTVPSGIAQTSPPKRKAASRSKKAGGTPAKGGRRRR
jgi:hypothetical protein